MVLHLIYTSQALAGASTHHQLWWLCLGGMFLEDFLRGGRRSNAPNPVCLPPWQWRKPAWLQWHASSICYARTGAGDQGGSGNPGIWKQCGKVRNQAGLRHLCSTAPWPEGGACPCSVCPGTGSCTGLQPGGKPYRQNKLYLAKTSFFLLSFFFL